MYWLLASLGGIAGLVSLVCFIMVLIKMFQNGQTGLAIACIVLLFCIGIGAIIALVVGWQNADRWRIRNIMMIWTICFAVSILCNALSYAFVPAVVVVR
jgi:hypothetical protein